jgi:hypothetical protein
LTCSHDSGGHQKVFGGFISLDLLVDFGGEIQIMDDGLTKSNGYAVAASASLVVVGTTEK